MQSDNGPQFDSVTNSLALLRNGDSSIAQIVLNFPKHMEKLSGELEL